MLELAAQTAIERYRPMENIDKAIRIRRDIIDDNEFGRFIETAAGIIYPERPLAASDIRSLWRDYLKEKKRDDILSLYIHIPFCSSVCSFCSCYSHLGSASDIRSYAKKLVEHISRSREVFDGAVFDTLYIGGGTPSIMDDGDFNDVINTVFSNFKFSDEGQRCSEMNPLTASIQKMKMLKEHGFTRLSFGAQSFDAEVLALNGRGYQTEAMVRKAITDARTSGFKYINLDLIVGLYGDTSDKLVESFRRALSVGVQRISLYALQPLRSYLQERFHSNLGEFDRFWKGLLDGSLERISQMAKEAGFSVPDYSKWYLKMSDCASWSYQYRGVPSEEKEYIPQGPGRSVFAIGENPTSRIDGVVNYRTEIFSGDPDQCTFVGDIRNEKKEMINYLIGAFSMKSNLNLSEFKDVFKKDLLKEFDISIGRLKALNAVRINGDELVLMTEDKKERALHTLMFFDDKDIEKVIKK
ncbi:MAG: radical SAM protein [Candidatus Colwellbacteria bacterium]|nr:radical SAM protein [Candidatus Colwellbacteria bacterium]